MLSLHHAAVNRALFITFANFSTEMHFLFFHTSEYVHLTRTFSQRTPKGTPKNQTHPVNLFPASAMTSSDKGPASVHVRLPRGMVTMCDDVATFCCPSEDGSQWEVTITYKGNQPFVSVPIPGSKLSAVFRVASVQIIGQEGPTVALDYGTEETHDGVMHARLSREEGGAEGGEVPAVTSALLDSMEKAGDSAVVGIVKSGKPEADVSSLLSRVIRQCVSDMCKRAFEKLFNALPIKMTDTTVGVGQNKESYQFIGANQETPWMYTATFTFSVRVCSEVVVDTAS